MRQDQRVPLEGGAPGVTLSTLGFSRLYPGRWYRQVCAIRLAQATGPSDHYMLQCGGPGIHGPN